MIRASMDTTFAQAIAKISELPLDTQRFIGEALLDGAGRPDLPVIEFTAEEEAMLDEAIADVERGDVIGQEKMKTVFAELRARSLEASA